MGQISEQGPVCSILCTTYNHAKYSKLSLQSVYEQDYPFIEIIVVDDGSKDGNPQELEETLAQSPFPHNLILQENTGNVSLNVNRALDAATGEYVSFLSLDDILMPSTISEKMRIIRDEPETILVASTSNIEIDDAGKTLVSDFKSAAYGSDIRSPKELLEVEYNNLGSFYIQGCVMKTETVREIGGLDTDITGDDLILRTKMLQHMEKNPSLKLRMLDTIGMAYRKHTTNLHLNNWNQLKTVSDWQSRFFPDRPIPEIALRWIDHYAREYTQDQDFEALDRCLECNHHYNERIRFNNTWLEPEWVKNIAIKWFEAKDFETFKVADGYNPDFSRTVKLSNTSIDDLIDRWMQEKDFDAIGMARQTYPTFKDRLNARKITWRYTPAAAKTSQTYETLSSLELELMVTKIKLAKANSQLAKTYANIDLLQSHLRDARSHPLKQLKRKVIFDVLRVLAKASPPFSARRAERFLRSAAKRDPNRNDLFKSSFKYPTPSLTAQTRSPKDFDPEWYQETYPDVADYHLDPLEHYMQFGKAEGRRANDADLSRNVSEARLDVLKVPVKVEEVVLFVTFAPAGRIKPHVPIYLDALKQAGLSVVVIITADDPDKVETDTLIDHADGLFIRQNGGFDFAAWAHVAREVDLADARLVCLANDSLVGPFTAESLCRIMTNVRKREAPLVGLTTSCDFKEHLQSYFLVAKGQGVQTLSEFLKSVRMLEDKKQVIFSYEIQLLDYFRSKGHRADFLFPPSVNDNRSVHDWRELISEGFPFVKMEVLQNPEIFGWKSILIAEGYDAEIAQASVELIRSSVSSSPSSR